MIKLCIANLYFISLLQFFLLGIRCAKDWSYIEMRVVWPKTCFVWQQQSLERRSCVRAWNRQSRSALRSARTSKSSRYGRAHLWTLKYVIFWQMWLLYSKEHPAQWYPLTSANGFSKRILPTVRSGSFEKSEPTIVSVGMINCIFIFRSFLDVYKTADRETPL